MPKIEKQVNQIEEHFNSISTKQLEKNLIKSGIEKNKISKQETKIVIRLSDLIFGIKRITTSEEREWQVKQFCPYDYFEGFDVFCLDSFHKCLKSNCEACWNQDLIIND